VFECQIDHGIPFTCPRGAFRLPPQRRGAHALFVRAGGAGMLYDPVGVLERFVIA
jgi:hypothetical protein